MTKVTEHKNNQLRITIPIRLAVVLGIKKGDEFDFVINNQGRLEMVKS